MSKEFKSTLALAKFILETVTAGVLFILIAGAAVGLRFISNFASHMDSWTAGLLRFAESVVLTLDVAVFSLVVLSHTWRLMRELWQGIKSSKGRRDA